MHALAVILVFVHLMCSAAAGAMRSGSSPKPYAGTRPLAPAAVQGVFLPAATPGSRLSNTPLPRPQGYRRGLRGGAGVRAREGGGAWKPGRRQPAAQHP